MSIGDRIKQVRGNLSRDAFASKIGADKSTVQRYENENNIPKGDILLRIHTEFGTNIHWLLTGEGEQYLKKQPEYSVIAESGESYDQPTQEEHELIRALRAMDPLSRRSVYLAAIDQLDEAIREKAVRRDKIKRELLEKSIKNLTKAVSEM
jgi:transcriptional regulator with XRE-family HTH domain